MRRGRWPRRSPPCPPPAPTFSGMLWGGVAGAVLGRPGGSWRLGGSGCVWAVPRRAPARLLRALWPLLRLGGVCRAALRCVGPPSSPAGHGRLRWRLQPHRLLRLVGVRDEWEHKGSSVGVRSAGPWSGPWRRWALDKTGWEPGTQVRKGEVCGFAGSSFSVCLCLHQIVPQEREPCRQMGRLVGGHGLWYPQVFSSPSGGPRSRACWACGAATCVVRLGREV